MDPFLQLVADHPVKSYETGQTIIRQGERKMQLYVLVQGSVEVVKNDTQICVISEKGAVFGEISILLHNYHNATVRALAPSTFHVIENAEAFLAENPQATLHIAKLLARRLAKLNSYFTELKLKFTEFLAQQELPEEEHRQARQLLTVFWGSSDREK